MVFVLQEWSLKNLNMLEDKDFYDSINHIKSSISYLSNTIEDFRSFLDKDKVLSNVNINHLVQKSTRYFKSIFTISSY